MIRTNTAAWSDAKASWRIDVTNDEGKRKSFYSAKPGRVGQREANAKADAWLDGTAPARASRFGAVAAAWLEDVKVQTGTANYKQTESYLRLYVLPIIGEQTKMERVSELTLQRVLNDNYAKKHLSKKTLQNLRGVLTQLMRYARRGGLTTVRTDDLQIPKDAESGVRTILQPSQLAVLFDSDTTTYRGHAVREWNINLYRFAVTLGLRPGELLGLRRENFDEVSRVLRIRGAINVYDERTRGKNDNAIRDEALAPIHLEILKTQLAQLREEGVVSPYIFPTINGDAQHEKSVYGGLHRYLLANGLSSVSLYELRHTFVSAVSSADGMTLADLKSVVGHSKNMDTLGAYGHSIDGQKVKAAAIIGQRFETLTRK